METQMQFFGERLLFFEDYSSVSSVSFDNSISILHLCSKTINIYRYFTTFILQEW